MTNLPMARPESPQILIQLRHAKSHSELAEALRSLKNEIVGHHQKKEEWIAHGVLDKISRTIRNPTSTTNLNGGASHIRPVCRKLSEADDTRLQALQLIASFAQGGPEFLSPLYAAQVLPDILSSINPYVNPPQIVVAALRALTNIADVSALADSTSRHTVQSLANSLLVPVNIESLNAILSTSSSNQTLQTQAALAAGLIQRLCRQDKHQHVLVMSGVLDTLASRLASVAVDEGHVLSEAKTMAAHVGLLTAFPEPAPKNMRLGPILHAIETIIGDSKYRANRLVHAPAIMAVFPPVKFEAPKQLSDPRTEMNIGFTAMEYLLPAVPIPPSRTTSPSHSSAHTPDFADSQMSNLRESLNKGSYIWESRSSNSRSSGDSDEEMECPLIPWLILLERTRRGYERLKSAAVLASLYRAGLGHRITRERSIAFLVIPVLVDMLAKAEEDSSSDTLPDELQRIILEGVPHTLARLMTDCECLQKAAYECDAAKVLARLLRRASRPVESGQRQMWVPYPDVTMEVEERSPIAQLGERGEDALLVHRVKVREGVLKAIAALAAGGEDYRKAFTGSDDFIPLVVESLSEFPGAPRLARDRPKDKSASEPRSTTINPGYGRNPLSVIAAGCHVVRTLSRSVSILRTAIVDYDVASSIFRIMGHANIDMQIAATASVANLVMEVSPVRELLTERGVMSVLCEQAHSDNASLRLNALWALKHFVHAVPPELKKSCLEELESGWLVQLICDDSRDSGSFSHGRGGGAANEDVDEDGDLTPPDNTHRWIHVVNGSPCELDASSSTKMRQAEDKLAAIREAELDPQRRARNEDVAIAEQGLEFIRNFIGIPGGGSSDDSQYEVIKMTDYLFNELGQDRLFEMLTSKLRARVINPFSRRTQMPGRETRVVYPQPSIIIPVIYILTHMAASAPRHRQLVVAQTELLKTLANQVSNKDREVRLAICHLVTNILWQEDPDEAEPCMQRAMELKKLGYQNKLELMKSQDQDLNVRERAKNAAWMIDHACN